MRFSLLCGFDHGRSIMLHALGYHRAYGVALLVGLLCSFSLADFTSSDSQNLQTIRYTLEGPSDGDSIWALLRQQKPILNSIDSKLSSVSTISSDVVTIKQYLDYNLNGDTATDSMSVHDFIQEFNRHFFKGVDRHGTAVDSNPATVAIFSGNGYSPFIEPGSSFNKNRTAQMVVTNLAETYWLEKINDSLSGVYDRLGIVCNTNFWYLLGSGSGSPYAIATAGNWDFKTREAEYIRDLEGLMVGTIDVRIFLSRWADYRMTGYDFFRSFDYNNMSTEDRASLENGYKFYFGSAPLGPMRNYLKLFSNEGNLRQKYYGTYLLTSNSIAQSVYTINNGGLSANIFTNLVTADGSIENSDQAFTNSETSVFNKFATSFLPSSLFNPDQVNTSLFSYVDSGISETPTFNPSPLRGGTRSSSRADASFNYDFEDSVQYDYNLVNPLKTATDVVQGDTDIDDKFNRLADLVNQRISSIFDSPLNSISQQPSRWSVKFRNKDGQTIEEYVASQQAETTDGISFACWVLESTMFLGFFIVCVRRSLRIGNSLDPQS